jgi:lactate dehydrogenase-like 2-hydroxyacid dehydrogenase
MKAVVKYGKGKGLWKCGTFDVVPSSHVGFYSEESIHELKRRAAQIVSTVLSGKWPKSVVNPEVKGKARALED